MMTLLVVTYKSEQKVPEQASEFYENLFQILLSRHDKTNLGYSRHKKCEGLTERQLQEIFEEFCYLTSKDSLLSLSSYEAYEYGGKASDISDIPCRAEDFINDICKISCMILEDGLDYHFIHKSVQQYYCARFIKRQPDELAELFYGSFVEKSFHEWRYVLNFCNEIDTYRMTKYFVLPQLMKTLNSSCVIEGGVYKEVKDSFLNIALDAIHVDVQRENVTGMVGGWSGYQGDVFGYHPLDILIFHRLTGVLGEHAKEIKKMVDNKEGAISNRLINDNECISFYGTYLVSKLDVYQEFKDAVNIEYLKFYDHAKKLESDMGRKIKNASIFEI